MKTADEDKTLNVKMLIVKPSLFEDVADTAFCNQNVLAKLFLVTSLRCGCK